MGLNVIFDEGYYCTQSALEDAREWMAEELELEELEGGRYSEAALSNRAREMKNRYLEGVLVYLDRFLEGTSDFRIPNPCAGNTLIARGTAVPGDINIYSDILQIVNFPPFATHYPYNEEEIDEYQISKIYEEDGDLHIQGGIPGNENEVIVHQITDSGEWALGYKGMDSVWDNPELCQKLEYADFAEREYGEYSESAVPSYAEIEER